MFWNKVFWGFFAATEAAFMSLLAAGQPYHYFVAGVLMMPMAFWKLAEDAQRNKEKGTLVKRSILKKLKKRGKI
jgi:hypothetical protein